MSATPRTSLRLGTRASALATTQSGHVADLVRDRLGREVELVEITTEGDTSSAPLAQIGGTGVFVSALREEIRTPGLSAEEAFNRTRTAVTRASRGEQVPSSLGAAALTTKIASSMNSPSVDSSAQSASATSSELVLVQPSSVPTRSTRVRDRSAAGIVLPVVLATTMRVSWLTPGASFMRSKLALFWLPRSIVR